MDPVSFYVAVQLCMAHIHHHPWTGKRYYDDGFAQCEVIREESWSQARREANIDFINRIAGDIETRRRSAAQ